MPKMKMGFPCADGESGWAGVIKRPLEFGLGMTVIGPDASQDFPKPLIALGLIISWALLPSNCRSLLWKMCFRIK